MIRFTTLLLVFLALSALPSSGQYLSIFNIDASAFPTLKAKMYAFDAAGGQVSPSSGELSLTENGIPRTILSVACPPIQPPRALSSVLVVDISGSMASGLVGGRNIDLAKSAAHAWINALSLGENECAVTSFDHLNYLNQDFTTDVTKLSNAIDRLTPNGGTDYDMGLLLPVAGGLQISKNGKHQKVIVFLTDGLPNKQPDVAAIVAEAQRQNCIIYSVTLNMVCPQSLKDIAAQTGGEWFQGVTTIEEAENVYRQILYEARSGSPCEITWQSTPCPGGYRDVELAWGTKRAGSSYIVPSGAAVALQFAPSSLFFRSKPVGSSYDSIITVTAVNSGFVVANITSSNPAYDINPKSFSLADGQSTNLTVTYTPSDSSYTWTEFQIESDACPQFYYASGGFPGVPAKNLSLKVDHPNGGESFVVESDTVITWSGIPATDWVKLEYSTDNGLIWKVVEPKTRGGRYAWHVPKTPSNQCLVRAKRLDDTEADDAGLIHVLPDHTNEVVSAEWSADGNRIVSGGRDNTAIIWDAGSGTSLHVLSGHTNSVYHSDWSPDNKLIVTASWDKTAKIWDAATGALIRTLSGHTNPVYFARWSPDGSKIVTASSDNTAKIWDAATGTLIHTLSGHTNWVYDAEWSPDGTKIATVGRDQTVKIWDAATGALIHNMIGHTNYVLVAYWSPDGSRLATVAQDNTAKIWDPIAGTLITTLNGHTAGVVDLSWSPDGSRVATSSLDNTGKIWNASTGALISTLSGHTNWTVSISWSPDGTMVATSSLDGTGKIWNPTNGVLLQDLVGHSAGVQYIRWSPDGLRVVTASLDKTVRIWYVRPTPPQEDVSDAVFSIVEPKGTSIDVDMGKVPVGTVRDSVVTAFVSNPNPYPLRVDSIKINGGSASLFSLVSGIPPFEVPANGASQVEFGFKPSVVGSKSAQIVIYTQSTSLLQTIRGEGVAPAVEVVNSVIDFGQVDVGRKRDSLQAVTIKNAGSVPLDITGTRHAGPNDVDFTTLTGAGPFTLLPGETARVDLRFLPSAEGRTDGQLLFEYNGTGSPAVVQLLGEGVVHPASASIRIADAEAKPGDTVNIPLTLMQGINIENSGATAFAARLRFNATLLEPIGSTPAGTIDGEDRVIDLQVPTVADPEGVLTTLSFRAGLGNDSVTALLLEQPTSIGGTVAMTLEAGEFRLLGICSAGGARLLNPNGEVVLKLTGENPVLKGEGEIELETIEIGTTSLVLHDLSGVKIATYIDGDVEPGRRQIRLNLNDVPAGLYFLTLATPTETRTVPLWIAQ